MEQCSSKTEMNAPIFPVYSNDKQVLSDLKKRSEWSLFKKTFGTVLEEGEDQRKYSPAVARPAGVVPTTLY